MTQSQGNWLTTAAFFIFILMVALTYKAFAPGTATKYEYQIVSPADLTFEARMNSAGAEGWQISSCRRATSSEEGGSASYECIMQRQKGVFQ